MTDTRHNDRLYRLLPAIYRQRDAEVGEPLRQLLDAISDQVDALEAEIAQRYDNWFIETCQEGIVPYLGDLVGYRLLPAWDGATLPRRGEVADTIRQRRRKGTMAVLEDLAESVAGWPGRAIEFDRQVATNASVRYPQLGGGGSAALRSTAAMSRLGAPDDPTPHLLDVRRPASLRTPGRYNLPSLGVFVWRLQALPVTRTQAYCSEASGDECFTFSVLGNEAPLFARPGPSTPPAALRRRDLDGPLQRLERHYGEGRSFALWLASDPPRLLPVERIDVADLRRPDDRPRSGQVAVDPEIGRIAFASGEAPEHGLLVSYHYGQAMPMGGGEYARPAIVWQPGTAASVYTVGSRGDHRSLHAALRQWQQEAPTDAVIELSADDVSSEPVAITLGPQQSLVLRAAAGQRPVIRILDRQANRPDHLGIQSGAGSRLLLDGLLIVGRGLNVRGQLEALTLRDCTLVPGWSAEVDGARRGSGEASLRLHKVRPRVRIERSVLGPIAVSEAEPPGDPFDLTLCDSIVDSTDPDGWALGASDGRAAHVVLTVWRSTLVGRARVEAVARIENAIFTGVLEVERRQVGEVRYSHVPANSRTPARSHCQPDLALANRSAEAAGAAAAGVRPLFESLRYGDPGYARLSTACDDAIRRGADDHSEMGVFHALHDAQRRDHLQARLEEFAPAGCDVGVLLSN